MRTLAICAALALTALSGCLADYAETMEDEYDDWEDEWDDHEDEIPEAHASSHGHGDVEAEPVEASPSDGWPEGYAEEVEFRGRIACHFIVTDIGVTCQVTHADSVPYHSVDVSEGLTRVSIAIGDEYEQGWAPLFGPTRFCAEFLEPEAIEGVTYCDHESQWFHAYDAANGTTADFDEVALRVYVDQGQITLNPEYRIRLLLEYWGGPAPVVEECECPDEPEDDGCGGGDD